MQTPDSVTSEHQHRLRVLDGWRGISILLVLLTHLFPLGPKRLNLAAVTGSTGMAVFFCLSGFLITSFLLNHSSILDFLIRRFCRIVPLAWLALPFGLWMAHASWAVLAPNALFYANLPPFWLVEGTRHFWSLCVEVQFYISVAILFAMLGKKGLYALPVISLVITVLRIHAGEYSSIVTWYRVDEILSGAALALVYQGPWRRYGERVLAKASPWVFIPLLLASSHPLAGWLNYLRPYVTATIVGYTLYQPQTRLACALRSKTLAYVAEISYALYVLHPIVAMTWLGSGNTISKYAKRPLLVLTIFGFAHASTFWFERRFIEFGRRISARLIASKRLPSYADRRAESPAP